MARSRWPDKVFLLIPDSAFVYGLGPRDPGAARPFDHLPWAVPEALLRGQASITLQAGGQNRQSLIGSANSLMILAKRSGGRFNRMTRAVLGAVLAAL